MKSTFYILLLFIVNACAGSGGDHWSQIYNDLGCQGDEDVMGSCPSAGGNDNVLNRGVGK